MNPVYQAFVKKYPLQNIYIYINIYGYSETIAKEIPMRAPLTPKQQRVYDYLEKVLSTTGTTPSLRAMADQLSISHAAVAQILKTLEEKAYIRRQGRYSRTLHLCGPGGQAGALHRQREIPIIGRITAGLPLYAHQEWEESLLIDQALYPAPDLFALRVQGFSMKNAGILDRDIAICTPRQYAQNREIVVALLHGEEATIKRFFLHDDAIELRPENPEFKPRRYPFDAVLIQGKVVGIIRPPQAMDH